MEEMLTIYQLLILILCRSIVWQELGNTFLTTKELSNLKLRNALQRKP